MKGLQQLSLLFKSKQLLESIEEEILTSRNGCSWTTCTQDRIAVRANRHDITSVYAYDKRPGMSA